MFNCLWPPRAAHWQFLLFRLIAAHRALCSRVSPLHVYNLSNYLVTIYLKSQIRISSCKYPVHVYFVQMFCLQKCGSCPPFVAAVHTWLFTHNIQSKHSHQTCVSVSSSVAKLFLLRVITSWGIWHIMSFREAVVSHKIRRSGFCPDHLLPPDPLSRLGTKRQGSLSTILYPPPTFQIGNI